jgi:hypothetical protein
MKRSEPMNQDTPKASPKEDDINTKFSPEGGDLTSEVLKPGKVTGEDVGVGSYGDTRKPFKGI